MSAINSQTTINIVLVGSLLIGAGTTVSAYKDLASQTVINTKDIEEIKADRKEKIQASVTKDKDLAVTITELRGEVKSLREVIQVLIKSKHQGG